MLAYERSGYGCGPSANPSLRESDFATLHIPGIPVVKRCRHSPRKLPQAGARRNPYFRLHSSASRAHHSRHVFTSAPRITIAC